MPHILISICFPVSKLNSLAADTHFTNYFSDGLCVWHIHLSLTSLKVTVTSLSSTLGTSVFFQQRLCLYILPADYKIHLTTVKSGFFKEFRS